jgi:hypothetical protein
MCLIRLPFFRGLFGSDNRPANTIPVAIIVQGVQNAFRDNPLWSKSRTDVLLQPGSDDVLLTPC